MHKLELFLLLATSLYICNSQNKLNLQALALHNKYRNKHNADNLSYCSTTANMAQQWAYKLQRINRMQHRPFGQRQNRGENLAMGADITTSINMWYNEVKHYNFQQHRFSMATGHFTQVVWKATKRLGCGQAGKFVVCNYYPAGNVQGQFRDNVAPAKTFVAMATIPKTAVAGQPLFIRKKQ